MKIRVDLWNAIEEYTQSCGGNPAKHVYGNTTRQRAVAAVERAVDAELDHTLVERDAFRRVVELTLLNSRGWKVGDKNSPGHCHAVDGIWDPDNYPETAGKPCEWCAAWKVAVAALGAG